ncbi:ribonuclease Z, mitochondrial isoform X2 [Ooceraea biroi]|nr:ribonuclease Z, mitochondrial isoform X2 [Ooceraea biroi]
MPRSTSHVLNMQRVRQKIMEKSVKHLGNTQVSLQILGSGARGTPRCVYLMTHHSKYVFNCGEGSQRLAHEHKCRLVKLEHIFVTSASWNNLGGVPGMLLTLQNVGVPGINVHGPKGSIEIFNALKRFVQLTDLKIHEAKCDELKTFQDQVMTVMYVPVINPNVQKMEPINIGEEVTDDIINYYDYTTNSNGKRVLDSTAQKESKAPKIERTPNNERISSVMSYICKLHPRAGKLDLAKCVEKGVKPGRDLGQLKAGHDVTLPDGTVVFSKDVLSSSTPGPVFLVVECPSEDYLEPFVSQPAFTKYQTGGVSSADDIPYCIVHFTPQNVMDDPRYVDWMGKFGLNTRHIVVNEENECMGTEAVHRHQHKLHTLHPDIFPFLNEDSFKKRTRPEDLPVIHRARTLDTVHLQPELLFDKKKELLLQPEEYLNEIFETEGFLDELAEVQTILSNREKSLPKNEYPKIVMLGTGCSIPSKVRNTSGILVRVDENHSILLDCGEGTFGQIVRIYGRSEADNIVKTIKAVYVSHLHADHHMGLINLLKEREKATQDLLYLLAPKHIASWLQMYHKRFEPILHRMRHVYNSEFLMDVDQSKEPVYADVYAALNVQAITMVHVRHCPYSYGISVILRDGKKIVYSGDTLPSENLVRLGQDCDLLIHEATMEDDLLEEAKVKQHSTVSQAIQVGKQMQAKFTLLTHFSQRYSVIPQLPQDENRPKFDDVGIAYDNMHISLSQLPLLSPMYPALKLMFNKHYVGLEAKAAKRQRRVAD